MSGSSAKNFLQNGDTWVIGGEIKLVGDGVITKDGQPVVGGDGSGVDIPDGSITTAKIATGAVTDDKLAKPKVDVPATLIPKMVIGTTLEGKVLGIVPYEQTPTADHLAMYQFGGQLAVADPQADNDAANKKYVDTKTYNASAINAGTFDAARIPTLPQAKITNLTTDLAAKLTASKAAAQADSTATDVAGLVADFNALLAKLRTAGIIST